MLRTQDYIILINRPTVYYINEGCEFWPEVPAHVHAVLVRGMGISPLLGIDVPTERIPAN
jgi:hypothetical protein